MTIFIGIDAPTAANLNLAVQLLMGVALLGGMLLARRKRFRAHAICQSAVVLLNLIPIAGYMLPVFRRGVLPKGSTVFADSFYAIPAAHAALGTVAELLGLYIILRAGTNLLPPALRFKNYKRWMRTELALWWLVIALGIATYLVWYKSDSAVPAPVAATATQSAASPTPAASQAAPPSVIITMSNFAFAPKDLTIEPGTTVVWKDAVGRHTIKADDGSFESEVLAAGGEFRYKFEREGRYPYYCTLHGSAGGDDMAGTITVAARPRP